jgi:tetratricopeptide (TPR) repeat protein
MRDFATRTPISLNRAVNELDAAIAESPDYAQPYAGLADTYDLLREYTGMPATQAFSLAQAAARKALSLDPDLGDAHAALAFARYWGFWDARDSRAHFARAIALDPASPRAHHWYATFLVNQGDTAAALSEIDTALRLDPGSRAVLADRALILHYAGRTGESLEILRRLAASQPDFLSPHLYLADIAFTTGDDGAYLDETLRAAELSGAEEQAAAVREARRALAAGGRRAMLATLLHSQTRAFVNGRASAFSVARLHAALGDASLARAYLRLAFDRREMDCLTLTIDRAFDPLRGDAIVADLPNRLKRA